MRYFKLGRVFFHRFVRKKQCILNVSGLSVRNTHKKKQRKMNIKYEFVLQWFA